MLYVLGYLAVIIAANLIAGRYGPAVTPFTAFVFIGFDLTCRDHLHEAWHHDRLWLKMAALIGAGSALSYVVNQGVAQIAAASFVAFALAGAADTAVYHALYRRGRLTRMNGSNVVAAAVDSLVFPTLAFGALMPVIVLGQFAAKTLGGAVWAVILTRRRVIYRGDLNADEVA